MAGGLLMVLLGVWLLLRTWKGNLVHSITGSL